MATPCQGDRWGRIAARVMRHPGLSVAAKVVYATMATYADAAGWIWVKQQTLAADLDKSRSWINAAVKELEAEGFLQHDRMFIEGRQRASRYRLLDDLDRNKARDVQAAQASAPASAEPESAGIDSAVESADTNQDDGIKNPLSRLARESEPAGTPISGQWVPAPDDLAFASARRPDVDALLLTERFIDYYGRRGRRFRSEAEISLVWRDWLVRERAAEIRQRPRKGVGPSSGPPAQESLADRNRRIAREAAGMTSPFWS